YQNIMKFPDRYPGAQIYKIETNYRSTPEILNVANAAIASNVQQYTKQLAPARKSGIKPVLVPCKDGTQQAQFVAQRVLELREEGVELNKIAVLYRSHFHALELQLELTRRNIPFSITSGIRFFEQAHIKDVAAYLKLALNPRDELSFKRVVQLLPGIGGKGAEKLWQVYIRNVGSAPEPAAQPVAQAAGKEAEDAKGATPHQPVARGLQSCPASVPKKAAVAWAQLIATMSQLEDQDVKGNASEMLVLVVEAGYEDYLKETYTNYRTRMEDLNQLAIFARQFESCEEFLTQIALLSNVEAEDEQPASKDDEQLKLSTVHQAKGLEFDVVFVIMLCDGLFPSMRSLETED